MEAFKSFFIFEFKRFTCKRNTIIILLLLFFLLYFIQAGVSQYKAALENNEEFKKTENLKVSIYITYSQYGAMGIRMLFTPSPISVFFSNTGIISDMTAFLDSAARLNIFNSLKGKNGFTLKNFGFTDFSGIILYFGSLFALLFGYESFHHKEYLKLLSSISGFRRIYFFVILSRFILLLLLLLAIIGLSAVLLLINQVTLSKQEYLQLLNFGLIILFLLLFFFVLGTITSSMRSRVGGLLTLTILWFVLVFFIPAAVHTLVAGKAKRITAVYRSELEKFQIVMDYEEKARKKEGFFVRGKKITKTEKDMIEEFWNTGFQKIGSLEKEMEKQMKKSISFYQGLSNIFPSTFYFSVTNEISSKGYENLIDFYRTSQKLKIDFVRFYIDRIFYFSNYSKVEPFIKKDENMFYGRSRLPGSFGWGLFLNLFYLCVFFAISYFRVKKAMFILANIEDAELTPMELQLKKGDFKVLESEGDLFKNQLFNLFSGEKRELKKKGFTGKVFIDGIDIVSEKKEMDFLYICHPECFPKEIKAGDILTLFTRLMKIPKRDVRAALASHGAISEAITRKKIGALKKHEKGEIILAIMEMKNKDIYLVNDAARGMPIEFAVRLKDDMVELKEKGALVLYLTNDDLITVKSIKKGYGIYDSPNWCNLVEYYKELLDIKEENKVA